ncbi:unnamed protein product [Protopolystoma xenopodis]|uniref:Uncharacterized protein n=1 Tax=Protopolystoma xenopodis TaxID=117903 RepID=A0A3S4ZRG7_9PLAT|nr:unnamed protein product [Protopolystoma xenopodis]
MWSHRSSKEDCRVAKTVELCEQVLGSPSCELDIVTDILKAGIHTSRNRAKYALDLVAVLDKNHSDTFWYNDAQPDCCDKLDVGLGPGEIALTWLQGHVKQSSCGSHKTVVTG